MLPVSSVGPAFVELDATGQVIKRPDGELRPTNVDAPLAAVVPDVFRQVEADLDRTARESLRRDLAGALSSPARGLADRFAGLLSGPTGIALQAAVGGYLGPVGDGVSALFVDWASRRQQIEIRAADAFQEQRDQDLAALRGVRARVLEDFSRIVHRVEDRYPASLVRSGPWAGAR
jgi:hypothetical protein